MKAFSGKFVLRIPLDLHEKLSGLSSSKRMSLNQLCVFLLQRGLHVPESQNWKAYKPVLKKLKDKFKDDLIGVVLFGSQATGEATAGSDTDLLIILDKAVAINRSLYSFWDHKIIWRDGELNPHFVSYQHDISEVSGLWFEIALTGKVIYQKNLLVEQLLLKIKNYIADGHVKRHISNGHPYWVRVFGTTASDAKGSKDEK
ncbi:MAG: nucleotidyltransferase domain-containing protein [Deltaproteobacteria bacterium]|nr:nucleotidyltransferase domain-containing protein [Deltaproteobacteria bacterium]